MFSRTDKDFYLYRISLHGPDALYKGQIAANIAEAAHSRGGIITTDDLANYTAVLRQPANISKHNSRCHPHRLLTETA